MVQRPAHQPNERFAAHEKWPYSGGLSLWEAIEIMYSFDFGRKRKKKTILFDLLSCLDFSQTIHFELLTKSIVLLIHEYYDINSSILYVMYCVMAVILIEIEIIEPTNWLFDIQ